MLVEVGVRRILQKPLFAAQIQRHRPQIRSRGVIVVSEIPFVLLTKRTFRIFFRRRVGFYEFRYILVVLFGLTEIYSDFKDVVAVLLFPQKVSRYSRLLYVIVFYAEIIQIVASRLRAHFLFQIVESSIYFGGLLSE